MCARERPSGAVLVELAASFAADLAAIADTFDALDPSSHIEQSLLRLITVVRGGVQSYLGLSLALAAPGPVLEFTALSSSVSPDNTHASVRIPLDFKRKPEFAPRATLVFYASAPGAFVDLAADLAWITGRDLGSFVLDKDLELPHPGRLREALRAQSTLDQAIGVLIGRGYTPAAAHREIDSHGPGGASPLARATEVLASLGNGTADPKDTKVPRVSE